MEDIKTLEKHLKNEQKILDLLVQKALKGPITANKEIIQQSRKVDRLVEKIQSIK